MKIVVTGGTGYVGSHIAVELLNSNDQNYQVIILDNLSNSSIDVVDRIESITNKKVHFYKVDLLDKKALLNALKLHENIFAVIHCAGFKAVGESTQHPLLYYENNLMSTINLLNVMKELKIDKIIFSSSATVYGDPTTIPIPESHSTNPQSPYGRSKLFIENIIRDFSIANPGFKAISLRYFNPVGAHGMIGEMPKGIPNNLMPFIAQSSLGIIKNKIKVFGNDYNTRDGTGIRDYIHITDLAKGHLSALLKLNEINGMIELNLGTGKGTSVIEIIKTFEKVSKLTIEYEIVGRRPGDVAILIADPSIAEKFLNWKATKNLEEMCKDTFTWYMKNKG